jgi:xanthine dehydrogenase YagS FAD-binding subunit
MISEALAGGTDLLERRRSGVSSGPVSRLTGLPEAIDRLADGGLSIGAGVRVQALADAPVVQSGWPGLAAAAGDLATPEIRRRATVGGNLTQRTRCAYFRTRDVACLKKGGVGCPARIGAHDNGVIFDTGPCVHPHPSTLATALLAYEARIDTDRRDGLTLRDLLGDGTDGTCDHLLGEGEVVRAVRVPPPALNERAVYLRAASRALAEWPIAEIVVRVVLDATGRVGVAHVALGGVAPVPRPMPDVAARLVGEPLATLPADACAALTVAAATPLPGTRAKVAVVRGLVAAAVEAIGQGP